MLCRAPQVNCETNPGLTKLGSVEGKFVEDILLDTYRVFKDPHRRLVPENKLLPGEAVAIGCVHGNIVSYPLA